MRAVNRYRRSDPSAAGSSDKTDNRSSSITRQPMSREFKPGSVANGGRARQDKRASRGLTHARSVRAKLVDRGPRPSGSRSTGTAFLRNRRVPLILH